jgi:hypothetical protein
MPHEQGSYLGSVRSVSTLRARCVVDGSCWHLRTSRGRPMPTDKRHMVWVHGRGPMTATRAAWLFSRGELPPQGHIVYRTCDSYDCVLPSHLRCGLKAEQGAMLSERGHFRGQWRRLIANKTNGQRLRKVTPEMVQWLHESQQSASAAAHGLGISPSRVVAIRAGHGLRDTVPGSSVFSLARSA